MDKGFNLLTKSNSYSSQVIDDFIKVLGPLPDSYKNLILNYKTGYPSIAIKSNRETVFKKQSKNFFIESFHSLVSCYERINSYDRAYGLSANHRKFKLLPICTSGSSYQEYFLKQDSGEIFSLNPNEDMDIELELEKYKIANSLEEFIAGFEQVS